MGGVRSKVAAAAGVSLAVAIGVTGCGEAQQLGAKQQVSSALSGLENAHSVGFTVTLDTTTADAAAISAAEGDPMSASDRKTFAQVLKGDVVFDLQAAHGKTFGDSEKAAQQAAKKANASSKSLTQLLNDPSALAAELKQEPSFAVSAHLSGQSLFEFRLIAGVVYVRTDAKKIFSLAGQNPAELNQALNSLPPSMAAIGTAAKDKWVSVDLLKAGQAAGGKGLLKALPTPVPTSTASVAATQKLFTDLQSAFSRHASINSLGSSKRGNGYQLSAPAKQVAQAVQGDLVALVGKQAGPQIKKSIGQIPDKTFSVDVWVKNDKLTDVSLDLTQFLTKPVTGKKLAVNIAVAVNGGSVARPGGVTPFDVTSLIDQLPPSLLSGGLSGLTGSPDSTGSGSTSLGGTGLSKAQLKQSGLTDAQIKQLLDAQKKPTT